MIFGEALFLPFLLVSSAYTTFGAILSHFRSLAMNDCSDGILFASICRLHPLLDKQRVSRGGAGFY
jgi:hypothetical protein